jgi:hypothetical protein
MEKEKLVNGKWYKAFKSQDYYIKYCKTKDNDESANCSEHIHNESYRNYGGGCGQIKDLTPVKISEIAHLLPKNHPDLKQLKKSYSIW